MKIADYKPFCMVDGEGVRCSLYVSGCTFNCKGCYNKAIQNFYYGEEYTRELEDRIIEDLSQSYVDGLTLLGGEPFLNIEGLLPLVKRVRQILPNKTIWSWTGFTFDKDMQILFRKKPEAYELFSYLDVLVDGQFILAKKDLINTPFRGSTNQRIIDVKETIKQNRLVKYMD